MQAHVRVLRQLVRESLYIIDEHAVADAILVHASIRLAAEHAEVQNQLARLSSP
jgi:hypothetical protein